LNTRFRLYLRLGGLLALAAGVAITRVYVNHHSTENRSSGVPGVTAQFTLTTSDGRTVSDESYRGKWLLVYFGFTDCPQACPAALLSIGGALTALGPLARDIQPVFITIDPARDTPMVMAHYLTSFDPRIVGLVGTPDQIAAVGKNYRVYAVTRDLGRGDEAIDHSSYLYLVTPQGRVAKILTGDLPGHALAGELRRLIR
jgi:protein SCO1